ncbi:HlyD family secretion protein [Vibrio sp. Of7-15]|uniref:HlyD family secretion protein n=1 Tax=Vibrio sp. Of7-15 TaxID=2724879 RepID=UPI001EF330B0|nr:HlyD family efflux transporter periplasmic adaptor subunit [Vibrio sp. Of7-15]MCG7498025.1 HlyD family secretion protein [Vibrio sp. Of7-15]
MSIFRKEAVENQYNKLWGEVTLSQPLSYKVFSGLLIFIVISCFIFILNADYQKKQKVKGYLLPSKGVIKTYAPGSAYVSEVFIKEGQFIEEDTPMFKLEYKHGTASGTDLNDLLSEEIGNQLSIIQVQKSRTASVYENREQELNEKIHSKNIQIGLTTLQITQAEARKKLAQNRLQDYEKMRQKGFLSSNDEDSQYDLLLTLKQEIVTLETRLALLEQEERNLTLALDRLPFEKEKEMQELLLLESSKKNRLTELAGKSEILLRSSKSGRVTGLGIKEGQLLKPQQYMASILPKGAILYAELMVPTRAFGFITKGQATKIKLDAFPFQKFGMMDAEVYEMTENIVLPGEVVLPVEHAEPMYRVKAKLDKQTVQAYGKEMSLQAGMLLEADIIVEKRSLAEWLLDPLFSLKGVLAI